MPERGWLMATVLLSALLAVPASLPIILEQGRGEFYLAAWVTALLCTIIGSVCLFVSTRSALSRDIPAWCRCVSAASLAAFGPLAVGSTMYQTRASLAMAALVLAVSANLASSQLLRWTVGLLMTAIACALDATALIWPIGCVWSGLARRQGDKNAWVLLVAGMAGMFIAWLLGYPVLTGYRMQGAIYALHREVVILMPIVVLGLAGITRLRGRRTEGTRNRTDGYLLGWVVTGMCVLLLAVLGCPVNVRLCVLGLWWLMPIGLAELAQMLTSDVRRRSVVRRIGILLSAVLVVLSVAGMCGWRDGVLLTLYLLTEHG